MGLGYVGATTAACLLKDGHHVYGIDINPEKVALVGAGRSPVVEPEVEELLQAGLAAGRLVSGPSLEPWLDRLDLVLVCVGTPSRADGKLEMVHLLEVTRQLGRQTSRAAGRRAAAPGVSQHHGAGHDGAARPADARGCRGRSAGRALRGGVQSRVPAQIDGRQGLLSRHPRSSSASASPVPAERLKGIYDTLDAPFFEVGFAAAEMVKFVDNCFHALKVAFANEIGRMALAKGIDPQLVADMFLADTKLNISPAYLRPGGPFGGSCLPKDLSAMLAVAREAGVQVPVLSGTKESNAVHARLAGAGGAGARSPRPGRCCSWAFRSRRAPTISGTARSWSWPRRCSMPATIFGCSIPDLDPERLVGVNFALAAEHQEVLRACLTRDLASGRDGVGLVVAGKPMPAHRGPCRRLAAPRHHAARGVRCLRRRPSAATAAAWSFDGYHRVPRPMRLDASTGGSSISSFSTVDRPCR